MKLGIQIPSYYTEQNMFSLAILFIEKHIFVYWKAYPLARQLPRTSAWYWRDIGLLLAWYWAFIGVILGFWEHWQVGGIYTSISPPFIYTSISPPFIYTSMSQVCRWDLHKYLSPFHLHKYLSPFHLHKYLSPFHLHKYLHKYVGGIYTSLHKYLSPFRLTAASKEREIDAACS